MVTEIFYKNIPESQKKRNLGHSAAVGYLMCG